jgi:hypothetical protein
MCFGHFFFFAGRPVRVQIVKQQDVHLLRGKVDGHFKPPLHTLLRLEQVRELSAPVFQIQHVAPATSFNNKLTDAYLSIRSPVVITIGIGDLEIPVTLPLRANIVAVNAAYLQKLNFCLNAG